MNLGIGIDISGDKYGDLTEGGPLDVLLLEDGFSLLQEDGFVIILDQ